ncbi:MAG: sigma-70 family RNA polymerase sigma factor [Nocardioides sp.]
MISGALGSARAATARLLSESLGGLDTDSIREALILTNLVLAEHVARAHACAPESIDDLIQVGSLGLVKAVDAFDPSRANSFSCFATSKIEGEVRRHLRDHVGPIRKPRQIVAVRTRLEQAREELRGRLGRMPGAAEVAAELKVGLSVVVDAELGPATFTDVPVDFDGVAQTDVDAEAIAVAKDLVRILLGRLDPVEREIVRLHHLEGIPQTQVATEMNLTQSTVSRLLARAMIRMRNELDATTRA